jgi:hypothetical protein
MITMIGHEGQTYLNQSDVISYLDNIAIEAHRNGDLEMMNKMFEIVDYLLETEKNAIDGLNIVSGVFGG